MKKLLLTVLLVLVLAGGAFGAWYWATHSDKQAAATLEDETLTDDNDAPLVQPTPDASGNATYADPTYGFSVTYPGNYKIAKVPSDSGDAYLIQNDQGAGLQLTVAPYDGADPLTQTQIKEDLPDMALSNARAVVLPSGISAIAFNSSGGSFGDSIEVWFAHEGFIYQASTYASQASFLEQVMGTFRF